MVVRKKRKSRKLRGRTRTMGWGRIGQHRKSGGRGGRGAVGFHKHKWIWVVKYYPDWYGKRGFTPRNPSYEEEVREISLRDLSDLVERLRLENKITYTSEGRIRIDLRELGFNKLLGGGKIEYALEVITPSASKKAVEAIQKAGGVVRIER